MILQKLYDKGLIHPPKFLTTNTQYLTYMGSQCYGCATDSSDWDIYGWTIPVKEDVFPHLRNELVGFGHQKQRFDCWQEHHILDPDNQREYDFQIFSVIRYFHLVMENNPNCVDSLFVPENCIIHITAAGQIMRDNRKLFLHKGSYPKFRGYSFSQQKKMDTKEPDVNSKRYASIQTHGYDCKFASHCIRLLLEAEQILTLGDIDLQRDKEVLKSIRRGEWSKEKIHDFFSNKEKDLEKMYAESKLPWGPDEDKIKQILFSILEHHYGSLDKCIVDIDKYQQAITQIAEIINKVV
jgi:predicted nucleotidyltransferase